MKTIIKIFTLATCIGVANAELVTVEVFGWVHSYPLNIDGTKPALVGDLQFLCKFTYDDQTMPSVDGTFRNAIKDFRIDFSGGNTVVAASGHIKTDSNGRFYVTTLFDHNFPLIGNWSFNGNFNLQLKSDGQFPWFALPTANDLATHFKPYNTWINGNNTFVMGHTSMKVNSPSSPLSNTWIKLNPTAPDTFSWSARQGLSYDVYTSTNLSDWMLAQSKTATSNLGSFRFDHSTNSMMYIRVKESQ